MNDVRKIDKTYNRNYLRAEYNFVHNSAQMAARWEEFSQYGDRYNLQYRTANDGRVREEHAILHNTTLPVSDPFWNSFLPPNGWSCRCSAVQVRKGKYPMSDPELAMQRGLNCTDGAKRQIFRFNPGKSMRLFPERHPYMPKGCGDCDKRLNLAYKPGSVKCAVCDEVRRQARVKQNGELYKKLLNDPDYKDVEFNPETGALKATHVGHNWKHEKKDLQRFFGNMTREDLEIECQNEIYRMGGSCILRDESKEVEKGKQATALDAYINGILTDIRSITEQSEFYTNQLRAKNSQLGRWNHQNPDEKASTTCLYFHDPEFFSMEKLVKSVERLKTLRKSDPETKEITDEFIHVRIKKVLVIVKGEDEIVEYNVPE